MSGDIQKGIIPGDTIVVRDGKIAQIGFEKDLDLSGIETIVDVDGQIVCPGFIDCHIHNTLDDYAPQRGAVGCYADALYSGIGDKVDLGFVKWGRADILKRRNKLPQALADLEAARDLFDNSDEVRGQILTKLALAQVLYALGRTDEAETLYDQGVAQARAEGLHTYLESFT